MTHQDIVDRMDALRCDYAGAGEHEQARISKERMSLRELCGGLGHVFGHSPFAIHPAARRCVFCGEHEPEPDLQEARHG